MMAQFMLNSVMYSITTGKCTDEKEKKNLCLLLMRKEPSPYMISKLLDMNMYDMDK